MRTIRNTVLVVFALLIGVIIFLFLVKFIQEKVNIQTETDIIVANKPFIPPWQQTGKVPNSDEFWLEPSTTVGKGCPKEIKPGLLFDLPANYIKVAGYHSVSDGQKSQFFLDCRMMDQNSGPDLPNFWDALKLWTHIAYGNAKPQVGQRIEYMATFQNGVMQLTKLAGDIHIVMPDFAQAVLRVEEAQIIGSNSPGVVMIVNLDWGHDVVFLPSGDLALLATVAEVQKLSSNLIMVNKQYLVSMGKVEEDTSFIPYQIRLDNLILQNIGDLKDQFPLKMQALYCTPTCLRYALSQGDSPKIKDAVKGLIFVIRLEDGTYAFLRPTP